ncbi:MAG: DUF58 domain-containing protein [Chloroflexi bacterium]|nr:DUF58 domain-containing protein [Chloroflexota bacterium]
MTKAGWAFIAAGVFIYLVASQSQIGWLYLVDAIVWSLLILSVILPWYSLRSLRVERQILLPASALHQPPLAGPLEDETVEVKLKITNRGRFARHFIRVVEDCPFEQPEKSQRSFLIASLNARSTTVFSYTATCHRRGYYTAANATLQSSGLLGLMVRRRIFPLPLKLTVYPVYYQMEGLPVAETAWVDWGQAVKSSSAAEFYGSREYRYGDPLKHIHWRNTARLGHFMLKEFEQASQGFVTALFETERDFGTGRETTLEYSIKIAASLTKLSADFGRTIDIIAGAAPLRRAGWREAMDYLARLEVGEKAASTELTAAPEAGQVIVAIVPALETKLVTALRQLAGRTRGLVVILLEGFTPEESSHEFLSRLKGNNVTIISCSPGNLEAAIKKLSNFLSQSGKSVA